MPPILRNWNLASFAPEWSNFFHHKTGTLCIVSQQQAKARNYSPKSRTLNLASSAL
jgi:hypothetical protein